MNGNKVKNIADDIDILLGTNKIIRLGLEKLIDGFLEEVDVLNNIAWCSSKGIENEASVQAVPSEFIQRREVSNKTLA
jgi:hypothetical protein